MHLTVSLIIPALAATFWRAILSKERDKELREIKSVELDLKDLRKDMDKRLVDLREQVKDIQKRTAKKVAEKPLLALGVAFVAGMALGIALARSKD